MKTTEDAQNLPLTYMVGASALQWADVVLLMNHGISAMAAENPGAALPLAKSVEPVVAAMRRHLRHNA